MQKGFSAIIVIFPILLLAIGGTFVYRSWVAHQPEPESDDTEVYSTIDGGYLLIVYPPTEGFKCEIALKNRDGKEIVIEGLEKTQNCDFGMFGLYSEEFVGWSGEKVLVLNDKEGSLRLVDLEEGSVRYYPYDSSSMFPAYISNESFPENKILFEEIRNGDAQTTDNFILIDHENQKQSTNFSFTSEKTDVLFDTVNNGFLFVTRDFDSERVSTKFYFASLDNFETKLLLENAPVIVEGRGCLGTRLEPSQKGEVTIYSDCYVLDSGNISEDGTIHLKIY